ncbi:serine-threonine protein kinase 19-domain-containing protein [Annulohypoxylon maeteangense]|uniref:serine-threonine protein kinase 19-domain-containing protein n=1 Tax=Annulohypoxylon maeteangense TaxID=1927788 RepID=UPI00200809B4|nr:serine-threonine protein kinase 19-domain-containing protein [Annulohypoxylon maeteangense]KAI0890625.1 serine-threonine protein kinase 19-domain-containing protein [Annulohypoxylon maeteangense]
MSLRKILGGSSRIKKASKKSGANRSSPSSSPWASSLPRRKPGIQRGKSSAGDDEEYNEDDLFDDKLDDYGLVKALATDLNLRDTSQAILHIRNHMFSPMPDRAAGMNSTRIAEVLNYRKSLPPIVTISHIQTLLSSPSAVEREIAELARAGFVRKVVVPRRGDIGETVVLAADYEQMVKDSTSLDDDVKRSLNTFLTENHGTQVVKSGAFSMLEIDQLLKAGFLTSHNTGSIHHVRSSHTANLYSRPGNKVTFTSLDNISRQPTGSLGAVGGEGAIHKAGGSGGGSLGMSWLDTGATELKLAVPGNGTFLKLLSSALDHLVTLLSKSRFREAPETVLRDRWDGGIAKDEARYAAKRSRGEFSSVLPGQTRKWRQFYGLSFDWVLQEAVGSGLIEVFETRSVGRGVRAL